MRALDPFPIPQCRLAATSTLDWEGMARRLLRDVLQLQHGERVILQANPYWHAAMLEAVRAEIQRIGAIELATLMDFTASVARYRGKAGEHADAQAFAREHQAIAQIFQHADVFIWLASEFRAPYAPHPTWRTERILASWPGRAVHFHWFHDPKQHDPAHPVNVALDRVYERAVLDTDRQALQARMQALAEALAGQTARVTDAGTDLRFELTRKFHLNYGDASRERTAGADNARDREEEVPCGMLRAMPVLESVEGRIALRPGSEPAVADYSFGLDELDGADFRMSLRNGRVTDLASDTRPEAATRVQARYSPAEMGLGELVIGMNPLLRPVPGSAFPPYFGYGEGVLRLQLGDNAESGGALHSRLQAWLLFDRATLSAGERIVLHDGVLAPEFRVPTS